MNVAMLACHADAERRRVGVSVTVRVRMRLTSEALRRPRLCLRGFDFAIAGRRLGRQRLKQLFRDLRHALDRAVERLFIRFRRFGKSAELANELKRRGANLVVGGWRREVMQGLNVSAHRIERQLRCSRSGIQQTPGSFSRARFPFLLGDPLVEVGPIVNIQDVMIALGQHRQLRVAARRFRAAH